MSKAGETPSFEERIGNTLTAQKFGLKEKELWSLGKKEIEWDENVKECVRG